MLVTTTEQHQPSQQECGYGGGGSVSLQFTHPPFVYVFVVVQHLLRAVCVSILVNKTFGNINVPVCQTGAFSRSCSKLRERPKLLLYDINLIIISERLQKLMLGMKTHLSPKTHLDPRGKHGKRVPVGR